MSDPDLVADVYATALDNWMIVSMNALAIFEYATTFSQEVSSIWKRRSSGAAVLLLAVRYTMLFTAIVGVLQIKAMTLKECTGAVIAIDILFLLGYVQIAAFSALRVYALCGRSVILPATIFVLQLSPFAVNLYSYIESVPAVDPILGCGVNDKYSLETSNILTYTSRIPITLGDGLVVAVTWMKSLQQLRVQRSMGYPFSLSTLLFRDGTVYFCLLLVLNVLEMSPLTAAEGGYVISGLNSFLPLILVNRFMLNLHQLDGSDALSADHAISTLVFRVKVDIAGNMGQPLEHGWEAKDGDELEGEESSQDDEATHMGVLEIKGDLRDVDEAVSSGH